LREIRVIADLTNIAENEILSLFPLLTPYIKKRMGILRFMVSTTDGWTDEQMEIPSCVFTLSISSNNAH